MDKWVLFAIVSMVFAGFTSVIAKLGLAGISGELGLTLRTIFVFAFVLLFAAYSVRSVEWQALTWRNYFWLGLSGVTTTASWIFYYRAIKLGEVSKVALIDKGSFIVAVLMAWMVLGERPTAKTIVGSLFILIGLIIVSRK